MNKICTSLEQSKKLIELGIGVNTADMCWQNNVFPIGFNDDDGVPAWSFTALLNILPLGVELHTQSDGNIKYYYMEYTTKKTYFASKRYTNSIDAAFEMVVWLKENKKL